MRAVCKEVAKVYRVHRSCQRVQTKAIYYTVLLYQGLFYQGLLYQDLSYQGLLYQDLSYQDLDISSAPG